MQILKEALKRIKPSMEEEKDIRAKVNAVLKKINSRLRDAKAVLGGSGAKGTWLKQANDADIFVCFNYKKFKDKSDELADILGKVLKKLFPKAQRLHGSRDYFQIKMKDFTFEIVPILSIQNADKAANITDVSPLHSRWVKKHPKHLDDIRLTKQFCRSAGVYGAESYIQGFSGYICEVLTIHFKGFLPLVRAASKWEGKVVIDPQGHFRRKNVLMELNASKTQGPLVIVDPVQKSRNAAAAVSTGKFEQFRLYCRQFLKKPSMEFFEEKPAGLDAFKKKKKNNKLVVMDIAAPKGKRDIVGCKLLKMFGQISADLGKYGFSVKGSSWSWDKRLAAQFFFIIDSKALPKELVQEGPPLKMEKHAGMFRKKHPDTFVKNGRLYAKTMRLFTTPEGYFALLLKENPFECSISDMVIE